ncbi:MAG TPA: aldo/keto reductase [Holophaga sp.]|nr:aldo/keto reductase [Holophaga sp.]
MIEGMKVYLCLPVAALPPLPVSAIPARARRMASGTGHRQLLTPFILHEVLEPRLPKDGAALLALTAEDLYPGQGWQFVFGQASIRDRVGVWSIARLGNPDGDQETFRLCLVRALGTAVHETCHMFSMLHCTAYECCMCGSNSLEEADQLPLWLCPECAAKLCHAAEADPMARYLGMEAYCRRNGLQREAAFYKRSAEVLARASGMAAKPGPRGAIIPSMTKLPPIILPNGVQVPALGFGTWQIPEGPVARKAVACALEAGYRHVDTARGYGNEKSVGRAIRESGIPREEIFVTSKLPAEEKDPGRVRASFERTMEALGLEVLDLYLIHAPWPWERIGLDCMAQNKAIWKVFEALYREGRVRAIGVSNFNAGELAQILEVAEVPPMADQIRFWIGDTQPEVTAFCRDAGIAVEAYSPLATGRLLGSPQLAAMAERLGVSPAQVCIRYVLQKGHVALPKSVTPERIRQNLAMDFTLDLADMVMLDRLPNAVR